MRPLPVPNLPQGRAALCVMQAGPYARTLRAYGIGVLSPVPCGALSPEERQHADLLLCHPGGDTVFLEPGQRLLGEALSARGFKARYGAPLGGAYPENVKYNFAVGADLVLGRLDAAEPALAAFLKQSGKTPVHVRQGYAKCSLCFVTENAFITEDAAVARALASHGKEVLPVSAGDVYLSDKHHGFFGGAAGLIAPDVLAVAGSLSSHRDGALIAAFLQAHGVRALELSGGKITDIGGILPLMEEL